MQHVPYSLPRSVSRTQSHACAHATSRAAAPCMCNFNLTHRCPLPFCRRSCPPPGPSTRTWCAAGSQLECTTLSTCRVGSRRFTLSSQAVGQRWGAGSAAWYAPVLPPWHWLPLAQAARALSIMCRGVACLVLAKSGTVLVLAARASLADRSCAALAAKNKFLPCAGKLRPELFEDTSLGPLHDGLCKGQVGWAVAACHSGAKPPPAPAPSA